MALSVYQQFDEQRQYARDQSSILNLLKNKMKIQFNMFCTFIIYWIGGNVNCAWFLQKWRAG